MKKYGEFAFIWVSPKRERKSKVSQQFPFRFPLYVKKRANILPVYFLLGDLNPKREKSKLPIEKKPLVLTLQPRNVGLEQHAGNISHIFIPLWVPRAKI